MAPRRKVIGLSTAGGQQVTQRSLPIEKKSPLESRGPASWLPQPQTQEGKDAVSRLPATWAANPPKPLGLDNSSGINCYLNTFWQTLLLISPKLGHFILNHKETGCKPQMEANKGLGFPERCILCRLKHYLKKYRSGKYSEGHAIPAPRHRVSRIHDALAPHFWGNEKGQRQYQQDVQEFGGHVLSAMYSTLYNIAQNPELEKTQGECTLRNFEHLLMTGLNEFKICLGCGVSKETYMPTNIIQLYFDHERATRDLPILPTKFKFSPQTLSSTELKNLIKDRQLGLDKNQKKLALLMSEQCQLRLHEKIKQEQELELSRPLKDLIYRSLVKIDPNSDMQCHGCGEKGKGELGNRLVHDPEIITFMLGLAAQKKGESGPSKLESRCHPPIWLHMDEYLPRDQRLNISEAEKNQLRYKLAGCIYHEGPHVQSGHYICIVDTPGGFRYCEDTTIKKASLTNMLTVEPRHEPKDPHKSNPYLYFYVRSPVVKKRKLPEILSSPLSRSDSPKKVKLFVRKD